jgi:hypothetical protein
MAGLLGPGGAKAIVADSLAKRAISDMLDNP